MTEIPDDLNLEKIEREPQEITLGREILFNLQNNKMTLFGLLVIAALVLVAIFAPLIVPYDKAIGFYPEEVLKSPSIEHIMGTDDLGRDIFARVIWGSRVSVEVGILAVIFGLAIGLFMGALAGYKGGLADVLVMRMADIFFAFPYILGAIAVMTILGPGLRNIIIAIGILEWAYIARLFRSSVLATKVNDYVEAARAIGASDSRILIKHILPNAIAPVIVYSAMSVGTAIITEAALSFLGIGVQPPRPSWGSMLADSQVFMSRAPWMMYFPGLAILITVLGFVLFADGLRDVLDPKLRGMSEHVT
ncbi:ABC transporter permease [Candidatus Oleimmundimicrobium sp.]|uniref:ABC transporter permease n=1 Tax=Candidatus Oleimmundimicrobium sp. TaxID=3060597 RepID=UPI00271DC157|nr:ABC transporter permease [Candidatus Oleimmundimicrobium sp.]MDO8885289.1 ABC transporter permease [Candidatus Oleimmundimicrobium sp.]